MTTAVDYLKNHKIIRELEKSTGITLDDLLERKVYAPVPSAAELEHLEPVHPKYWGIAYDTRVDDDELARLQAGFKQNGSAVQDAALLVAAFTLPDLSERQRNILFQATRHADHNTLKRKELNGRVNQQNKASKPRNTDMQEIIERMAAHVTDGCGASQLWGRLAGEIQDLDGKEGEPPHEQLTGGKNPEPQYKWRDRTGAQHTITLSRFRRRLREAVNSCASHG